MGRRRNLIIAAGLLPLAALVVLFVFDVPIGRPFFLIYRYSSFLPARMLRAIPALMVALMAIAVLYKTAREGARPLSGRSTAVLLPCYICLAAWTFVGPPEFVSQHAFNLLSPSHEGAFVLEAREITSIREYVSRDFYARLQNSPEVMRGRRILSNPPGMTLAAVLCNGAVENAPWLRDALIGAFDLEQVDDPRQRIEFAGALLLALAMTVAWAASILPAYGLCRLWLPQTAAICLSLGMVFNPATVTFAPGKDPAQLLTVSLILAGWLGAYVRGKASYGTIAGISFAIGTMLGLVHVWLLIIAAAATLAHAVAVDRKRIRDWLLRCALPGALAAAAVAAVAALALDWNLPRTMQAVATRYGEIQLPIITDPFYWTVVGLPMFLLFVGPLFWMQMVAIRERPSTADALSAATGLDDSAPLGRWVTWATVAVMVYSYFLANNSETPRLWIPFVPPLLLGMALRRKIFRDDSADGRRLMVLLMAMQILVTIAFWALLDVRESEWRLSTGRMWD